MATALRGVRWCRRACPCLTYVEQDQCLWVQLYGTVEELRQAVAGFVDRDHSSWLIQRHGHRTPKEADQAAQSAPAA